MIDQVVLALGISCHFVSVATVAAVAVTVVIFIVVLANAAKDGPDTRRLDFQVAKPVNAAGPCGSVEQMFLLLLLLEL